MANTKDVAEAEVEVIETDDAAGLPGTNVATMINDLREGTGFSTSLAGQTWEDKKLVAKAMSDAEQLIDHVGEEIQLTHYIVQKVELADDRSGELNDAPRVTLIAADGSAFVATSVGVLMALRTFINAFGDPNGWPEPLTVVAKEERSTRNSAYRYLTLKLV